MNEEHKSGSTESHGNDYERQDANPWFLGGVLVVGLMVLGVILVLVNDYFILEKEKLINEVAMKPESSVLRDVQAHADNLLTSYAVIDSAKGIYRIPIEHAIKLQADEAYVSK